MVKKVCGQTDRRMGGQTNNYKFKHIDRVIPIYPTNFVEYNNKTNLFAGNNIARLVSFLVENWEMGLSRVYLGFVWTC